MKKVCIIMSSYNGEKFISQQLDSIMGQEAVSVTLYIRDDGSTDSTRDILNKYKKNYPNNIFIEYGVNIGWRRSFLELIFHTVGQQAYDYYSISDQDDLWESNKIISAIKKIEEEKNKKIPILYGSNLELVDSNINCLGKLYQDTEKDFEKLRKFFMLGDSPFGCTLVWNEMLQKVLMKGKPNIPVAYDQWVNLVANCRGLVLLDANSYIKHIIHDHNACGIAKNRIERIKKFFKIYIIDSQYVKPSDMVREYFRIYGSDLSIKYSNLMYAMANKHRYAILKESELNLLEITKKIRIFIFCTLNIM